jgi:HAD superfamily hydrolase (TIGR01509 family)
MKYEAILFDAGNTLVFTRMGRRARLRKALRAWGLAFSPNDVRIAFDRAEEGLFSPNLDWVLTPEQEQAWWRDYYGTILRTLNLPDDDALAAHLQRVTWYVPYNEAYPDALEALQALRPHVRLGVLSNAFPSMLDALNRVGLTPYFDDIVLSSTAGIAKPDCRAFQLALNRLGASSERTIFVDDSLRNVQAAQELELTALLVDRQDRYTHLPLPRIRTLNVIPDLVLGTPTLAPSGPSRGLTGHRTDVSGAETA